MAELSEKQRDNLDEDQFAFPKERKEPLNNASHVRNAIARFNQVEGVSDDEREPGDGSRRPPTSMASRSVKRAGARSARNRRRLRREQPKRILDVALEGLHEARGVPAVDDAVIA
jgi:uncharacterized protein DUF6582